MKTIKVKTIVLIEQTREYDIEVPDHFPSELNSETLKLISDGEYIDLWESIHKADELVTGEEIQDEYLEFE